MPPKRRLPKSTPKQRAETRALLKANGLDGYKVIYAPSRIDVPSRHEDILLKGRVHDIDELFYFLAQIRRAALSGSRRVFIDLSHTKEIGPNGAILLAAEIERCNALRPGRITGCEPIDPDVQSVLCAFGFYRAIGEDHPDENAPPDIIAPIRSGSGKIDDLSERLSEVAALAMRTWGDQAFTDRVHAALNEAITNVLMHAYDPALLKSEEPCSPGKWWVAGLAAPDRSVWFIVFDQGVGIPRSAPFKNKGLLELLRAKRLTQDHDILRQVVKEGDRSRTGLPQHGQGIPSMISLIRDRSASGTLTIVTGRAMYLCFAEMQRSSMRHVYNFYLPLSAKVPGTLLMWRVDCPVTRVSRRREA